MLLLISCSTLKLFTWLRISTIVVIIPGAGLLGSCRMAVAGRIKLGFGKPIGFDKPPPSLPEIASALNESRVNRKYQYCVLPHVDLSRSLIESHRGIHLASRWRRLGAYPAKPGNPPC